MKVERKIHHIWEDWTWIKEKRGFPETGPLIGKYHYIYSSPRGQISLVELPDYFYDGKTLWEIFSLEGNLFEDIERFDSKEEAEEKIKEYLEDD